MHAGVEPKAYVVSQHLVASTLCQIYIIRNLSLFMFLCMQHNLKLG